MTPQKHTEHYPIQAGVATSVVSWTTGKFQHCGKGKASLLRSITYNPPADANAVKLRNVYSEYLAAEEVILLTP